tara:strand:+ start:631 stop:861 length:231 start_codon:yes stop_codon:yes gene_type:complete
MDLICISQNKNNDKNMVKTAIFLKGKSKKEYMVTNTKPKVINGNELMERNTRFLKIRKRIGKIIKHNPTKPISEAI